MIGRTQFAEGAFPYQGLVYPDGTCLDADEVAAVAGVSEEAARRMFPERRSGSAGGRCQVSRTLDTLDRQGTAQGTSVLRHLAEVLSQLSVYWRARNLYP